MRGASALRFAGFLVLMVRADASCNLGMDTLLSHRADVHMKIITRKMPWIRYSFVSLIFVSGFLNLPHFDAFFSASLGLLHHRGSSYKAFLKNFTKRNPH